MSAGWAVMLCLLPGAAALQEQAATALAPVVEGAEAAACRIRFTGRTPTARDRLPLAAQQLAAFSEVHQRVFGV